VYKRQEDTDLCHFVHASEKDYGVQCVIVRDFGLVKEYTIQNYPCVKSVYENRPQGSLKDVAFMHVASPGKAFERFDQEKYKIVMTSKAYFNLLNFFHSEWSLVVKRIESDYQDIKSKKEWITLCPTMSFRGMADIVYKLPLDDTNSLALNLVVTKRVDNGKTNIALTYTDETLGSIHLPPGPMVHLAQDKEYIVKVFDYKEPVVTKRSRQC